MKTETDVIAEAIAKASAERHPYWPRPDFEFYAVRVKKALDEYRCSGQLKMASQLSYDWLRGRTEVAVKDVCRELEKALGLDDDGKPKVTGGIINV